MRVYEREILVPRARGDAPLLGHLCRCCHDALAENETPIRFVVTRTDAEGHHCEVAVASDPPPGRLRETSVFDFREVPYTRAEPFIAALLIPTGIGAEIGGHAGDANAVARLLASACDTLVTHPNVVNASDINELTDNGLYVEGSVLARLMMGTCALQKVRANRVILIVDRHAEALMTAPAINAAGAARATMGTSISRVVVLPRPVVMKTRYAGSGRAVGEIAELDGLLNTLAEYRGEYDAVALASVIDSPEEMHSAYVEARGGIVNPWGGVEAMLTHVVSQQFDIPSAHAPLMASSDILKQISDVVDPRMAAEELSSAFIHCVLKGLHRSPAIVTDPRWIHAPDLISAANISCLVIPDRCLGLPVLAAMEHGIPVVAVRENRSCMRNDLSQLPFRDGRLFVVDNYLEAAGVMTALRAGVAVDSVRRPLPDTPVTNTASHA